MDLGWEKDVCLCMFNKRTYFCEIENFCNSESNYCIFMRYILFPTELHLKNVYYLYSACSNPTNVVLVTVLSMIIGKGA